MLECLAFSGIMFRPSPVAAAPIYHHPSRRHNSPPLSRPALSVAPIASFTAAARAAAVSPPMSSRASASGTRIVQELIRYQYRWAARAERFIWLVRFQLHPISNLPPFCFLSEPTTISPLRMTRLSLLGSQWELGY